MPLMLPCVRFIRCFDMQKSRMVNLWFNITTQDQLMNAPMAMELVTTQQTVEECMVEIRKLTSRWLYGDGCLAEKTIEEIEKASKHLVDAQPSFYGVGNA